MAFILVVEDDMTYSAYLLEILKAEGHEVAVASDGLDALKMLRNMQDRTPQLFILDHRMPEMSGYELVNVLRSEPSTKNIPILLITAAPNEVRDLVEQKKAFCLSKINTTHKEILDCVKRLLSRTDFSSTKPPKNMEIDRGYF